MIHVQLASLQNMRGVHHVTRVLQDPIVKRDTSIVRHARLGTIVLVEQTESPVQLGPMRQVRGSLSVIRVIQDCTVRKELLPVRHAMLVTTALVGQMKFLAHLAASQQLLVTACVRHAHLECTVEREPPAVRSVQHTGTRKSFWDMEYVCNQVYQHIQYISFQKCSPDESNHDPYGSNKPGPKMPF